MFNVCYRRMSSISSDGSRNGPSEANKKALPVFNSYMSLFQVQEKLKKGEVIEVRSLRCHLKTIVLENEK